MKVDTVVEATRLAYAALAGDWTPGTFHIPPDSGWVGDDVFLLEVGAREWLVDGDEEFQEVDDVVAVVDRASGAVRLGSFMEFFPVLGLMRELPVEVV